MVFMTFVHENIGTCKVWTTSNINYFHVIYKMVYHGNIKFHSC